MAKGYSHLTANSRFMIEKMLLKGFKIVEIADTVGCSRATIYNELKRATYVHHSGDFWKEEVRYAPERAHQRYRENLKNKGRPLKICSDPKLKEYIEEKIVGDGYSPEATLFKIKAEEKQFKVEIRSVNTLYSYIKRGVFENITMEDCPYRKPQKKKKRVRIAKKAKAGTSIEQRPDIEDCEEFGHWEMDTVKGNKSNRKTLLVLTERKTRQEIIEVMKSNTTKETVRALNRIEKNFGSSFFKIFHTITVDNGVEFSDYEGMEKALYRVGKRTEIYYCHPYRSSERGSNENQNKLVRRHFPKGSDFDKTVNKKKAKEVEAWINNYPRKIFDGKTAGEMFEAELLKLGIP